MYKKVTELESKYKQLNEMSIETILSNINKEDQLVANVVRQNLPAINAFITVAYEKLSLGGRLFYIGAGTSGRLGVLDASECPPTFGVRDDLILGLIAGGDTALRKAKEGAEDDTNLAWSVLQTYNINKNDIVLGISSSGSTPFVLGGLAMCKSNQISTACLVNNPRSIIAALSDHPIEVVVGPEFISGSTRMKAGTAQKMILNMISTTIMIKLGKVKGNKMVDMKLSNNKLKLRGIDMLVNDYGLSADIAKTYLDKFGSVREVINQLERGA